MSTPAFEAISVEGGLLSVEYLHSVARIPSDSKESKKKSPGYGVPARHTLRDEINRGWINAKKGYYWTKKSHRLIYRKSTSIVTKNQMNKIFIITVSWYNQR